MESREAIDVVGKRTFRGLQSLPILGIVLFIFAATFPPLDLLAQINLPIHMGQHALIAFSGLIIAYPLYLKRKAAGKTLPKRNSAILGIAAIAVIVALWHTPLFWDAAVLNPIVHGVEHVSFLAVGLLLGFFFPALPDNFKFMTVFLGSSGHMAYGIYLFIMNTPVYPLYPVAQQNLLGALMIFPSPFYFVGLMVYSLHRETKELEGASNPNLTLRTKNSAQTSIRQVAVVLSTLVLIALFVGYLALTAGTIYTSAAGDPVQGSATVYIIETPVTWNYSPQNVKVVIGVNNTVVWVSHSLSEDTVTSASGIFNSGALKPGESWSFTFTKPGVYSYFCDFHPWMQGLVTVLPANSSTT